MVTFNNILYISGLRSNLISMARLSIKGAKVYFKAIIRTKTGIDFILATCSGLLYVVEMDKIQPTTFTAQLKQKHTSFATWYRCLAYARAETIQQMISKNLVDRLNICGKLSIGGLCKDCIYGKYTAHLYNDYKSKEKKVLKHMYIDIWGLCQVQSASGAIYFMIIMDGFSSYRTAAFLKSKSAEITLKVFKGFYTETEQQTRKRLKHMRLNMEKEWYNTVWEQYCVEQNLDFEFTIPYAHQQNGVAEQLM